MDALCLAQTTPKDGEPVLTRHDVIVVTATRTETEAVNPPVSAGIVEQTDIERQQMNNPSVGETVRSLPEVSAGSGNGNIPAWIQPRGTGCFIGRTLYMVDELPPAEPAVSIAVNPANLDTTEVLLGRSSSLYGANASGGVVNMRSISAREPGGLLGFGYGTFATWRPQVSATKAWRRWNFLGSYNLDKSNGYKNTDLPTGLYLMRSGLPSYLNQVNIEDRRYTNNYSYQRSGFRDRLRHLPRRDRAGAQTGQETRRRTRNRSGGPPRV